MEFVKHFSTIDTHVCGEPMRIITGGIPFLRGQTISEKAEHCRRIFEADRRVLLFEPRGHHGMCACIVTEPVNANSDFGVIFMNNGGYSRFSGHGIIAVVTALLETGHVRLKELQQSIYIDTEIGVIAARAHRRESVVEAVSFENKPAFVHTADVAIPFENLTIQADISFGGEFYATVDAVAAKLPITKGQIPLLQQTAHQIKQYLNRTLSVSHPDLPHIQNIAGVVFFDASRDDHVRNVTVFADRQVNRSPSGTAVSALLATLVRHGGQRICTPSIHESIIGTSITATLVGETTVGHFPAVIAEITGTGFVTGIHQMVVDPTDPLAQGFLLQ
ncbi:proline racemase family protein [Alicyclobacillus fastidiosus]|uniref:Proline racemase family protein n=1 Tax=Alicyclobacillus fastidiosus TaxID=392011 RepID=A0ABY6ZD93_9BACL|nr:proline racemase family protein [Alicyclobacillus fastidiosus]WAH40492.1 proline racemase family protein [Alicyclobacillus fastidiosus]GMA61908.1 trans-3-hydroxy-L-proline dehydratase [Alicyclobacillus fastidiosus]